MKIVRMIIKGGVIQHIDCPKGVRVVVRDYDTDDLDDEFVQKDEHGDRYLEYAEGDSNAAV